MHLPQILTASPQSSRASKADGNADFPVNSTLGTAADAPNAQQALPVEPRSGISNVTSVAKTVDELRASFDPIWIHEARPIAIVSFVSNVATAGGVQRELSKTQALPIERDALAILDSIF